MMRHDWGRTAPRPGSAPPPFIMFPKARQRPGTDRAHCARHRRAARRGGVRAGGRDRSQRRHPRIRARGIPLFNIITRTGGPASPSSAPTTGRLPETSPAICSTASRCTIIVLDGTPASAPAASGSCGFEDALAKHPASRCDAAPRRLPARRRPRGVSRRQGSMAGRGRLCYLPTTSWRLPGLDASIQAGSGPAGWSASTPSPGGGRGDRQRGACSPPPTSTPGMSEIATEAAVRHLRGEAIAGDHAAGPGGRCHELR